MNELAKQMFGAKNFISSSKFLTFSVSSETEGALDTQIRSVQIDIK